MFLRSLLFCDGRRFFIASCALLLVASLLITSQAHGDEKEKTPAAKPAEFSREQVQFFETQIQPLLKKHCYQCHAGGKHKGGLRLDYRGGAIQGGDSGPAVDVDNLDESLLLAAINYDGFEMPPKGKLPAAEIALLTKWVKLKAPWRAGGDAPPKSDDHAAIKPPEVNEETKAHWSFQRVKKPQPPKTTGKAANPIDAFILKKLQEAGIKPAGQASKRSLIRRLFYDLTGLPPEPHEVKEFMQDESPQAYEKLVDRLLKSPHYGERWGRHWLDLVRYAETNSYERDGAKPFVWRYRDYVIRSFNEDKPYDQFIREQLAGDELDEYSPQAIVATGYYRLGIWDDEPVDQVQANFDDLDDVLSTTGQVFLGLTIGCARCHDHKLDPLPQKSYYSLLSFFTNIKRYGVRGHDTVLRASVQMVGPQQELDDYKVKLADWKKELQETENTLREMENAIRPKLKGGVRDDFKRERVRLRVLRDLKGDIVTEEEFLKYEKLFKRRDELRRSQPQGLTQVLCVKEHGPTPKATHILIRGNAHAKSKEVQPEFPEVLGFPAPQFPEKSKFKNSTGRRRVLADWIASPENPLTARVMVNRVWQYHFGKGLVASASDFGLKGDRPTHPQLLDWLAAEFVEGGWRLKSLHKKILMSQTYRRSYRDDAQAAQADPLNKLYWRFDMRRLSAEEIRDSILAATGELRREKMYGPSIYSRIPKEVLAGQSRPGAGWGNSAPDDRFRRSIYIHVKRSLITPILSSFDFPEPDLTCPVRFVSTQPTQALGLLNSDFVGEQAKAWSVRLRNRYKDDRQGQVRDVLLRVTQRAPSSEEIAQGVKLMERLESQHKMNSEQSLQQLCLLALNLNEFVYLD